MNLFVSYARVDKPLCKQIVPHLQDVHEVWYDHRLHAGQQWWNEIVDHLNWCDGFVYLLSPESVSSKYCKREFEIAFEAKKALFPVLIQAQTEIPDSLRHIHYADLSDGMEDIITLMNALTIAERRLRSKGPTVSTISIKYPSKPMDEISSNMALAQAADAMDIENFDSAVFIIKQALEKRPEGRIARILQSMLINAEEALERQTYLRKAARDYVVILELMGRTATQDLGCREFIDFQRQYPDYDPENIASTCIKSTQESTIKGQDTISRSSKALRRHDLLDKSSVIDKDTYLNNSDLLECKWIDIPNQDYDMGKYPITNEQFVKFIEAGGYNNNKWWTSEGWQHRQQNGWIAPRFWTNTQWTKSNYPVVGVSWYEAMAFCQWLSDTVGEHITLPTAEQWQYAAQGDDERVYPWGDNWDGMRCNNSVSLHESYSTTSVAKYEGDNKGNSYFGVVDMAGNVWEWCLSDTYPHSDPRMFTGRVLCGGSWHGNSSHLFYCTSRSLYSPHGRFDDVGFRLVRY